MAETSKYSLWLQRISNGGPQGPHPGSIPVVQFAIVNSRNAPFTNGSSGGKQSVKIESIELTVDLGNLAIAQLSHASNSRVDVGRGRIDAILPTGCTRLVMDFESAVVGLLSPVHPDDRSSLLFDLELWVEKPRLLWAQPRC